MFRKLIILVVLLSINVPTFAQHVDTTWVRRYNGPGNSLDVGLAITLDEIGDIYVSGWSIGSETSNDCATIKYYPNGDTAWVRRYNGASNSMDAAYAIAVDGFGSVYITGFSHSNETGSDYLTIKYYPDGETAWVRLYNGPSDSTDIAYSLTLDRLGNIYVTGYSFDSLTYYDFVTIKYDSSGNQMWVNRYNGPADSTDIANSIVVDDSGNVYVTGSSEGGLTYRDYATIKYRPNGNTDWVRRYNGPGNWRDYAYGITLDRSGNIYVTGKSAGSETSNDYATIKYYPNGDTAWLRRYNGPANLFDDASAVVTDDYGNVYVGGTSNGIGTNSDYAAIKYDSLGNELWVRRYDGPGNLDPGNTDDMFWGIALDDSDNVYVTGWSYGGIGTYTDCATIKYGTDGSERWIQRYNGPANSDDDGDEIAVDHFGNVYVVGTSYGIGTASDLTTIKYEQNYPPNSFSLLSPADSVIIPYVINFSWETSVDPEQLDSVKYDLYVSTSSSFLSDSTIIHDSLLLREHTDTLEIGRYYWKVWAYDKYTGRWSNQIWTFLSAIRGDIDGDMTLTVSDAVYLINYLFKNGEEPAPDRTVGDCNCDGQIFINDVIYLINYLFKGGQPPGCFIEK